MDWGIFLLKHSPPCSQPHILGFSSPKEILKIRKSFDFKNQMMITFQSADAESLSDPDYLGARLIRHCISLLPGILNKELF